MSTVIESISFLMNEIICIDLPSLRSVDLGDCALAGVNNPSCSLIMRSISVILSEND